MSQVINNATPSLVGKPPRNEGKPMFINPNERQDSVKTTAPNGPGSILINANGDMQKL